MTDAAHHSPGAERRVAVVLGMHRSGTSMLARMLGALGVDFGRRLLSDPMPDNALGYWEQADIVDVQETMLHRLNRTWYGPLGSLPLPEGWRAAPGIPPLVDRLREVLAGEVAASPGLWGFKDPRTARFLGLWRELFAEAGVRPVYILSVRHPLAVTGSLMARNAENGMTPERAQLLWLVHNFDIIRAVGDELAVVVDYDRWFDAPAALAAHLTDVLGLPDPDPAVLDGFVRKDLRHHMPEAGAMLPLVAETHAELVRDAPRPPNPERLRALAAALADSQALLADWQRSVEELPLQEWRLRGSRAAAREALDRVHAERPATVPAPAPAPVRGTEAANQPDGRWLARALRMLKG